MTLRTRIAVAVAAAAAVASLLGAAGVYLAAARTLYAGVDGDLERVGADIVDVPSRPGGRPSRSFRPGGLPPSDVGGLRGGLRPGRFGGAGAFVQVVDADGEVRLPVGDDRLPVTDRALDVAAGGEAAFETVVADGTQLRVHSAPLPGDLAVQVARPVDDITAALATLRWQLVLVAIAGVALAAAAGAAIARRLVAPVGELTRTAEEVAATQDLTHRIEVHGSDELARLAATFNGMLANLEQARRSQQQLVADASHELRTPLTSLRTNIEVLGLDAPMAFDDRRRLLRDVTVQLDEFGRLVGALVELARGDAPVSNPVEVRLDEVVGVVVERARARVRDVPITVDAEPAVVRGDPDRLERAVSNLVDNALKYGEGRPVDVTVSVGEVAVRDRGAGIAPADAPRVFDRFYRAAEARGKPGSGLGLAIVRQVAESHGGIATVEAAEGGGTRVRLRLPPPASGRVARSARQVCTCWPDDSTRPSAQRASISPPPNCSS